MRPKSKIVRYMLAAIGMILLIVALVSFYFYQQGGKDKYVPPVNAPAAPADQALNDLNALSKAVDAYYGMNLTYPDSLSALQPDFVASVPKDPATGKPYVYESDGTSKFRITVPDPASYKLKTLAIENGNLVKE